MAYEIEAFIEKSNSAHTRAELFDLFSASIRAYGYDRTVYTFITDHLTIGEKAGHGILGNYPTDWMSYYLANNYQDIDPVPNYAKYNSGIFIWEDLRTDQLKKQEVLVLDEAQEAGLHDGVGIPLYGARNEVAGVGLARTDATERPDRNMLSALQVITRQFHECYCQLGNCDKTARANVLTPRQIEVLKWMAIDKTASEIGMLMGVSENTVNYHKKEIYQRLEANSRILAVVKGIRQGIISLDRIVV